MADILERWLRRSALWGTRGMLVSTILFVSYIVAGWSLTVLESSWAPSEFLSIAGDPGFFLTGTLISVFVVQATASLILYSFLIGFEDDRSQFVVLMSYIGLGCGAASLRVFFPPSLAFLVRWL
ncbi:MULTISPECIES: hypothetical protein [unclassified Haladaptatus]|uniref:hypothetical protein n=1 Tax=unclassified Haladaptatus TaxID=2622732 RepID=UPI003624037B